jgi:hypothetical protein
MSPEWEISLQESVKREGYIPYPQEISSVVVRDHELHGPCVHWNYERNANYIVLSEYPLRSSNYVDIGRYKIYDIDESGAGRGRIRIPDSIDDTIKSKYLEGTKVIYMAYQAMINKDNPAVFLLTNPQFQRLLPRGAKESVAGDDIDLRESLLDLPAFIEPP